MPRTTPGPDRGKLGFSESVRSAFGFLVAEHGFDLADEEPTCVRYESDDVYVNIFHGRASYQINAEFGLRRVGSKYTLGEVISVDHSQENVDYKEMHATSAQAVQRSVLRLGAMTRRYAGKALKGDLEMFRRLQDQQSRCSTEFLEGLQAKTLRDSAQAAWRRGDFEQVVEAYRAIERGLATVSLKPSEAGRLRYAEKRTSGSDSSG